MEYASLLSKIERISCPMLCLSTGNDKLSTGWAQLNQLYQTYDSNMGQCAPSKWWAHENVQLGRLIYSFGLPGEGEDSEKEFGSSFIWLLQDSTIKVRLPLFIVSSITTLKNTMTAKSSGLKWDKNPWFTLLRREFSTFFTLKAAQSQSISMICLLLQKYFRQWLYQRQLDIPLFVSINSGLWPSPTINK